MTWIQAAKLCELINAGIIISFEKIGEGVPELGIYTKLSLRMLSSVACKVCSGCFIVFQHYLIEFTREFNRPCKG